LGLVWFIHYFNRSIIFPLRLKTKGKRVPWIIVLSAIFFNLVNASLNGYYLGYLSDAYPSNWFTDPRFIIGITVFISGFVINQVSDQILLNLRKGGKTGYYIPKGWLYRYVSCPNFFGEIIEWTGFAIMAWNLPALSFALWTAVNLIPRALDHHRWYKKTFPDYPKDRKAVIPFLV
jgi:steroid 5-alpha reductase family enzyme